MKRIFLNLLIALASGVTAQSNEGAVERLRLVHADTLLGKTIDSVAVQILQGHVELIQGEASMKCGEATYWQKSNRARLRQHVIIDDGEHLLIADEVDYNGASQQETARGHVTATMKGRTVKGGTLIYNQLGKRVAAQTNVEIEDQINHAIIYGEEAEYHRETDYARVSGDPVLVLQDTAHGDDLTIKGLLMESWGEAQRVLVTDSVHITKKEMAAKGNKAEFFVEEERLVLTGVPVLTQKDQQMFGDSIIVTMEDKEINGGVLIGNARIISTDSVSSDYLRGARITIQTIDDTTRYVKVEGQAESEYHASEKDGDSGVNVATGDVIEMKIINNQLSWIRIESDPGMCTGKFTPTDPSKTKSLQ